MIARLAVRVLARLAMRTAILSAAAALVIAAVYYTMYSVPRPLPKDLRPDVRRLIFRQNRRRPLQPELRRITGFIGEIILICGLGFAGRKILRLRL